MPLLTQGNNVTLSLGASDIVSVISHNGEYKVEQPSGTVIAVAGDTRAFGPFAGGGTFKLTANLSTLSYEQSSLAPAVGDDFYNIASFPGVVMGSLSGSAARQANGVALQAALDYCLANRLIAFAPAGRFEYECTTVQNSKNAGLQFKNGHPGFVGSGSHISNGTRFIQYAVNHAAITIGDVSDDANQLTGNATFKGFACGYGVSQTGQTQANALLIGRCCYCIFDDFLTSEYIVDPSALVAGPFHPYIALRIGLSGAQTFWSNLLPMCRISGGQANYFRMDATGTGNAWGAAYFGGGGPGVRQTLSDFAVRIVSPGQEFGAVAQLNIEWCNSSTGAMYLDGSSGMDIGVLHLEGNKVSGFNPSQILVNAPGRLNIGVLKLHNVWVTSAAMSGVFSVVQGYSDVNITIDHLMMVWDGAAEQVIDVPFVIFKEDTSLVGRRPHVEIGNIHFSGNTGAFSLDNILTAANSGQLQRLRKYRYDPALPRTEGGSIVLPSGVGTDTIYGAHKDAQVVLNTAIGAQRKTLLSTFLTSAGVGSSTVRQPGDTMNFYRTGGATGAFNWLIRDSGDTATLATLATAGTQATLTWTGSAWA